MNEEILTGGQAAKVAGRDCTTVYTWFRKGLVPAERNGREWRVKRSDLEEFLAVWKERQSVQRASRAAIGPETGALNALQAARRAKVHPSTIINWADHFGLPAERRRGKKNLRYIIQVEALDAFIANRPKVGRPATERPPTWAELRGESPPAVFTERSNPLRQPSPVCRCCGCACVTIGDRCIDCLWGRQRRNP